MALDSTTPNTGNFEILQPEWLWLLPALILLSLLLRNIGKYRKLNPVTSFSENNRTRFIHPLVTLLPEQTQTKSSHFFFHTLIMWITLALLVFALSQPVRIGESIPNPPQQKDVVFIVDTSVSMILRDYELNGQRIDRMSMLKSVLDEFTTRLQGNRISVIVYGDSAYTYVPLTQDQDLIRRQLSRIETGIAGRFKAVGEAIALAVKETENSPNQQRVMILFTDMHRATGSIAPEVAADLAAQANIPLFTVAIGATTFEAKENRDSGLIYEPANLELLNEIAVRTGALSYHASDADSLFQAINDIEQRKMTSPKLPPRYLKHPLHYWPLLLALLLFSVYQFSRLKNHS